MNATGLNKPYRWLGVLVVFLAAIGLGAVVAGMGIKGALILLGLPIAVAGLILIFKNPVNGFLAVIVFSFLVNGIIRYIPAPLGTLVDGLLLITLVAVIFKTRELPLHLANNPVTWIFIGWFLYTVLELFNPLARSHEAWFFSVRGVSIYIMLAIPLSLILFNTKKQLRQFFNIWIGFSILATLWAIKQLTIGPDLAEKLWLEAGGKITHIIQGQLRAFSFYSDAGQFGAAIGHASLAAFILGIGAKRTKAKLFYFSAGVLCFYGLVISGTRGALFVPIIGFLVFLMLTKNFRLMLVGLIIGGLFFGFLKFTTIGQANYNIKRMRSAFDPEDASLLVRKENQAKLAQFLVDKPFGGGLGSGGSVGQRFTPDSYLASIPFDSWYVKIWVETGIIGLTLHLFSILFVAVYCFFPIYRCKNPELKFQLMALYAGFIGISVASYGNQIFGQSPTLFILAVSIAFMSITKKLEAEIHE